MSAVRWVEIRHRGVLAVVGDDGVEDIVPRRESPPWVRPAKFSSSASAAHHQDQLHLLLGTPCSWSSGASSGRSAGAGACRGPWPGQNSRRRNPRTARQHILHPHPVRSGRCARADRRPAFCSGCGWHPATTISPGGGHRQAVGQLDQGCSCPLPLGAQQADDLAALQVRSTPSKGRAWVHSAWSVSDR